MKDNNMLWRILCTALVSAILAACSGPDDAPEPAATVRQQAGDEMVAPVGRLGDNVVPTKYAIELTIDPSQETFSGRVSIDVQISEPTGTIWLHGKDLDISEVYLTDSESTRIGATFEERLDSGVALLTLEQPAAAGAASIHLPIQHPSTLLQMHCSRSNETEDITR